MITLFQLFAVLFTIFAVSRVILRTIDRKLKLVEFAFWMFIWSGLIITAFFPGLISKVANIIGIGRGVDVIIYMSIGTLFYLMFRLYIKIEELDQHITIAIRQIAYMKKKK
ncbi:MAG: DUF2304 family protein [archaeon]